MTSTIKRRTRYEPLPQGNVTAVVCTSADGAAPLVALPFFLGVGAVGCGSGELRVNDAQGRVWTDADGYSTCKRETNATMPGRAPQVNCYR